MNIYMTNKILAIAEEAHKGQVDLAGEDYMEHIKRVARNFNPNNNYPHWVTAVLHDTLEDSDTTAEDLKKLGITRTVIRALVALTRNENETYNEYINRVIENEMATRVKLRDLEDNMNVSRLPYISTSTINRIKKYHKTYHKLKRALP